MRLRLSEEITAEEMIAARDRMTPARPMLAEVTVDQMRKAWDYRGAASSDQVAFVLLCLCMVVILVLTFMLSRVFHNTFFQKDELEIPAYLLSVAVVFIFPVIGSLACIVVVQLLVSAIYRRVVFRRFLLVMPINGRAARCPKCGYSTDGIEAEACPECGTRYPIVM